MITPVELHDLITRQVRRCFNDINAHPDFEVTAADQIVFGAPKVRDLLAAAEAVSALRDLHQPYVWHEASDIVSCRECRQSFPCRTLQAIDAQQVSA